MCKSRLSNRLNSCTVASRSACWNNILIVVDRFGLFERVDNSAMGVSQEELTYISGVKRHGYEVRSGRTRVLLFPEVRKSEGTGQASSIQIKGHDVSIVQSDKRPVKHGIRHQRNDLASDDQSGGALAGVEVPYSQLVLRVDGNKAVGGELYDLEGCASGRLEDLVYTSLTEDVDFTGAKLAFTSSDS